MKQIAYVAAIFLAVVMLGCAFTGVGVVLNPVSEPDPTETWQAWTQVPTGTSLPSVTPTPFQPVENTPSVVLPLLAIDPDFAAFVMTKPVNEWFDWGWKGIETGKVYATNWCGNSIPIPYMTFSSADEAAARMFGRSHGTIKIDIAVANSYIEGGFINAGGYIEVDEGLAAVKLNEIYSKYQYGICRTETESVILFGLPFQEYLNWLVQFSYPYQP